MPTCTTDGTTSCGIGCSLSDSGLEERVRAFHALFGRSLQSRESTAHQARWTFRWSAEIEGDVRSLAAAESECCSFFDFTIERVGDELRWTASVPEGREAALALLDGAAIEATG